MTDKSKSAALQLQETFIAEAREQIQKIVDNLIKLESGQDESREAKLIEMTFRELHNLKGSARAVDFISVEAVCHPLEDIMVALKRKQTKPTAELLDLLLSSIAIVEKFLDANPETTAGEAKEACLRVMLFMRGIGLEPSPSSFDEFYDVQMAEAEPSDLSISSIQVMPESGDSSGARTSNVNTGSNLQASASAGEGASQNTSASASAHSSSSSNSNASSNANASSSQGIAAKLGKNAKSRIEAERVETLRIPTAKLELFMQKAEEMLSVKAMARQQRLSALSLHSRLEDRMKVLSKAAPDIKAARVLMDKLRSQGHSSPQEQTIWRKINELLDSTNEFVASIHDDVKSLSKAAFDYSHTTSTSVDVLLDETKRLLMMPCGGSFEGFPLVVRQLARELGKEADLNISGGDIELDKRILSQIKDPLIHLLRNSLDHGLETPEERDLNNKPRRGTVNLSVLQIDGSLVEIRLSDDGQGINTESVKHSAMKLGMISADEAARLTPDESLALIFRSQLSTSKIITEISGRGIGMAVVEENIRRLGGRIKVESKLGKGTCFIITLPVTISTFRGVIVDVSDKMFVVPTTSIDRVVRIKKDSIKPVEGNNTMLLGDSLIPLCHMEDVLELPQSWRKPDDDSDKMLTVAILGSGDNRVGFVVDEVLEEHEVLVKSLGQVFSGIRNVSGVTILGSGKVVPILNSNDMLKWSRKHTFMRSRRPGAANRTGPHTKPKRSNADKKILVVDDTLTARILLKNIFESAGFTIKLANDGVEALEALKAEQFDLIVTDIEMPLMNGFELTEKIRQDSQLTDLPVIIVTSMTSREDREKGVAAGANAYFVKSSFDQSNLLDVIGTLI